MTKTVKTDLALVAQWANVAFTCGLLLVLVCTLFPFDFSLENISGKFRRSGHLGDIIANVFLFIPFGFGLTCLMQKRGSREQREVRAEVSSVSEALPKEARNFVREGAGSRERKFKGIALPIVVWGASCGLSLIVELLQVFLPSRSPTLTDIVTNSIGGLLGFGSCYLWGIKILGYASNFVKKLQGSLSVKNLLFTFLGYATLAILISIPLPSTTNFSNWNPDFPLLLGNEKTGDRPWLGYVSQIKIADRAISEEEVAQAFLEQNFFSTIEGSLLADYNFTGVGSYPDQTGNLPDLSWQGEAPDAQEKTGIFLTSSSWLETTPVASMTQKLRESSQFTLTTTIATADTAQSGPARIVSLSSDTDNRNFTLGQDGNNLVLRLRTPVTGENGTKPQLVVPNILTDNNLHQLVITYSAPVLRFYIDGVENLHSFALTPDVTFFRYLSGSSLLYASSLHRYKIMYYAIIFIPMGFLLALIDIKFRGKFVFRILLVGAGILLPSLVIEGILASGSQRAMQMEMLLLGMSYSAIAMLLFQVQARCRVRY